MCCAGLACAGLKVDSTSSQQWTQLSLSTCSVDKFLTDNPTSDGRGVVIAVLDTGVDPSIPGLTRTTTGEVKVIDVQDFTGQGDIELHWVHPDGKGNVVNHDDDGSPIAYALPASLAGDADDEQRRFRFGFFDEGRFINSDVPDLNDNGATDDKFAMLVSALIGDADDQAICFVDTNMNRSFADEKPLRNYKLSYDTFTLHREKPEEQIVPVTFAVNVFLRQNKITVVYDDGAHGTHVAGIAAGYRINNQEGLSGVAPGAKVMGLKIGKNSVGGVSSTEAMKRALEYAARYARENNVPVVCNMSYGVESVIDGQSDLDRFFDKLLKKNPHLIFCTSAGNEGPGLSTVGTPSAADQVISVAALLAADSARDVQGIDIDRAVLTAFSSRGGEVPKPDLATPGWSTSTVPRYVTGGDFWPGTSMASPYAAGLCAVLISDAMARHPGEKIRACDVRRALCLSAEDVPNTTVLDIGYGVPRLPEASRLLDKLVRGAGDDPVIGYDISTPCPHGYKGTAPASYWRSTYFPTDEPQTFTVSPVFAPGVDAAARTSFTRRFELRSATPWCKLTQEHVYLRSEQSARIYVQYDAESLTEPGVHVGVVEAVHDGQVAFRLHNTIVVPYRFSAEENFTRSFKDRMADGWNVDRYFLAVPPGASAMQLTLSAPDGQTSRARMDRIFDPTGMQHYTRSKRLNTDTGVREVEWIITDKLIPGIWEIDVVANRPDREWPYDFTARFFGLHTDTEHITSWSDEPVVTNIFEQRLPVEADGLIEGFRMHKEDNFEGLKDELTYTVEMDEAYSSARIKLEMTPEAYATTTDIGVAVENSDGEAIHSGAFSNRFYTATVRSPGGSPTLTVKIRAGFAVEDFERKTPIIVNIDRMLANPVSIGVTRDGSSKIDFVPGVPIKLAIASSGDVPEAPDGTVPTGFVRFRERSSRNTALKIQVDIDD